MRQWASVLLFLSSSLLGAQSSLGLRNVDSSAEFVYWIVPGLLPLGVREELSRLPLARSGPNRLSAGERVEFSLTPASRLVGVFIPLSSVPKLTTVVAGGYIMAPELPEHGTVQLSREAFAASNRGRALIAPLQAWNLVPERLTLDGQFDDWKGIPNLVNWGKDFQPRQGAPDAEVPRLVELQVSENAEALWIHANFDRNLSQGAGASKVSLILRREGAFLEWPLAGPDGRVWLWYEPGEARSVGFLRAVGTQFEARIPWSRMEEAEKRIWTTTQGEWAIVMTSESQIQSWSWAPYSGDDLP